MARPKSITTIKKEMEERGETLGNYKSIAQKIALEKKRKGGIKKATIKGDMQRKKIVKEFLKCNDIKEAALKVGIGNVQASRYINSDKAKIMFKEAFDDIGLTKESIAKITKEEFLEYNKNKIIKTDLKGNSFEEMRDGRLAFKALQFAADKIEPTKQEIEHNHNLDIDNNVANLAAKQLIMQVTDTVVLRELLELIESKLANAANIIDVAVEDC